MARILSVVQYYPPHVGGMEIVAQKQAESLAEAGFVSRVVTASVPGAPAGETREKGVGVVRVPAWNGLDKRFGLPFSLFGLGLWKTMRQEVRAADLVHLHDIFYLTSWAAGFWARFYGKPLMVSQHVEVVAHPSRLVTAVQWAVFKTFGRAIFNYARWVIVYTHNVRVFLGKLGVPREKMVEQLNGIDMARFGPVGVGEKAQLREKYGLPQNRPLALFVGRFVPKKGFDKVYAAKSERYDLVFVGSGSVPEEWRAEPRTHLLGSRTREEVIELYRACDFFVFPAVSEVFPLAVQEAMASGLPMIISDEPAYFEYGLDTTLVRLIPPEPGRLRQAMEEVSGSPQLRAEMGLYSRRVALEKFDWNANFMTVRGLYQGILQGVLGGRA